MNHINKISRACKKALCSLLSFPERAALALQYKAQPGKVNIKDEYFSRITDKSALRLLKHKSMKASEMWDATSKVTTLVASILVGLTAFTLNHYNMPGMPRMLSTLTWEFVTVGFALWFMGALKVHHVLITEAIDNRLDQLSQQEKLQLRELELKKLQLQIQLQQQPNLKRGHKRAHR